MKKRLKELERRISELEKVKLGNTFNYRYTHGHLDLVKIPEGALICNDTNTSLPIVEETDYDKGVQDGLKMQPQGFSQRLQDRYEEGFSKGYEKGLKREAKEIELRPFNELLEKDKDGNCVAFEIARLAIHTNMPQKINDYAYDTHKIVLSTTSFIVVINRDFDVDLSGNEKETYHTSNQLQIFQLLYKEGFISLQG